MSTEPARVARYQRPTTLYAPAGTSLDATDLKALRLLQEDAGRSVQDVADLIGLSHSATSQRVKRLEASGAIVGRVTLVDETVFEPWSLFLIEIVLTPAGRASKAELERAIAASSEIIEAMDSVGKCDLLLKVALPAAPHWTCVQNRLDPTSTFIDKARLRPIGRVIKRAGIHPLLLEDVAAVA
jgi:DNA-binding Lrp family transcriptional regulator